MKTIVLSNQARAAMRRLDPTVARQVRDAIRRYADTGQGDVTPLHGPLAGLFRLRVRGWRVRLQRPDPNTLHVLTVEKRGDAYR